ncbi:MAG: CBS domain-containing protein [Proteobacteria bacterium]|nr:CBS domain-containing protein [Pseudomonadota bacterium]
MTVAAILKHKGHAVSSVAPGATIEEVARMLAALRIGAVLVIDATDQLLGIVSERDIVAGLASDGPAILQRTAGEVMTRGLFTVSPATTVAEAMAMMTSGRVRHLPVMDSGMLVGLVSIGDVVKARITQQEYEVDNLKAYVAGSA